MDGLTLMRSDAKGGGRELVAFRLAGQEFALDIMNVREIRGWTPVTPLPEAPDYITGVVNLRGAVLPILDLAVRLGLPSSAPTSRHAIIVVQAGSDVIGLLVESLSEIMNVAGDQIQPTPDVGCSKAARSVTGLLPVESRMVGILSLESILPEDTQFIQPIAA